MESTKKEQNSGASLRQVELLEGKQSRFVGGDDEILFVSL